MNQKRKLIEGLRLLHQEARRRRLVQRLPPVPATPAAASGDTVTTSTGRVATVLERRSNDMLYVELDGNANGEGAAFERKT